ncbi:hypothetical protein D3C87_377340 [compost metagenome]
MKNQISIYRHPLRSFILGLLVAGSFAAPAFAQEETEQAAATYHREIEEVQGQTIYIVNGRAPHLYMISRDLYGNEKYWVDIAKWNNVTAPFALTPGQRLVIKRAPTNTNAQGDSDLIKSWTGLQKWTVVQGIKGSQQPELPNPAAATAPVVEEEKVEEQAQAALKAELEGTPTPAETLMASEKVPEPTPAPAPTAAPLLKAPLAPAHHSRWHFGISAAASVFELESDNHANSINNVLNSEVDYGVDLEAAYRISEQSHLIFTAMVEHMDISHADDVEVEGHSQYIWKFSTGLETEVTSRFSLAGSLIYEQLPFVTPTGAGATVDAIYIPQLSFGGRLNFVSVGNFKAFLVGDVLMLMPKFENSLDIKAGEGFVAGLKFQNKLQKNTLSYGVTYRYIQQNTTESDNNQKAVFASLGLLF